MWRGLMGLSLVAAALPATECRWVRPAEFARMEVSAYDLTGARIPKIAIELIDGEGKRCPTAFRDGAAEGVPYGTYTLRVTSPGFQRAERRVPVEQPALPVRVALRVEDGCGPPASISGAVKGARPGRELWVKAVSVHGVDGGESRVGAQGGFTIAGLASGRYILLVMDGDVPLLAWPARIEAGSQGVVLELPAGN